MKNLSKDPSNSHHFVIKTIEGWSLLELTIVLCLVSLIGLAGLPSLNASITRSQSQRASENILKAFELARQEATTKNHIVTLCGVIENKCEGRGKLTLSIFIDENNNKIIDANEEVVRTFSSSQDDSELLLKASLGRNYFRFKENGTAMETGSISYCPSEKLSKKYYYSQIIKLNYSGRAYLLRNEREKEKQSSC